MDIKKSLIRFTSLLLSCLMVLSTPITALADGNLNQNASSDGLIPAGVDAAYAHKFYAYPSNQGWRFTIVNKEGVQVSNSVDAITYFPGDIERLATAKGDMNTSSSTGSIADMVAGYKKYKSCSKK